MAHTLSRFAAGRVHASRVHHGKTGISGVHAARVHDAFTTAMLHSAA
jgi:hypothetical protein